MRKTCFIFQNFQNKFIKKKMLTRLGFLSLRRSATKFAALTVPRRWFIKEQVEGNETAISSLPSKTGESKVAFWEEALAKKETALVLQDRE